MNKNTQKREKRKRRIKRPDLGRAKSEVRSPYIPKKRKESNKCLVCNETFKNIKILHGEMIKHVCKCNEYLVEAGFEKVRNKRKAKEKKNHQCTIRTIESNV